MPFKSLFSLIPPTGFDCSTVTTGTEGEGDKSGGKIWKLSLQRKGEGKMRSRP